MRPVEQPAGGSARAVSRINPAAVRGRQFPAQRRGVNAAEVRAFLSEVADELAALQRELIIVHQENERLKRALRDWQTRHSRRCHDSAVVEQPRTSWPTNPR